MGSGPNGLAAACALAGRGFRVHVLEAHPERLGGAAASAPSTLPGYVHDVGAAFFTFGKLSPAFRELDLESHGVRWLHADFESCHPAPDGSVACIAREPAESPAPFGTAADAGRWSALAAWHRRIEGPLLGSLLGPVPTVRPALGMGPANLLRLARILTSSPAGLARRLFDSEAARRVLPGLALHVDVGPLDRFGAGLAYVLGLVATTGGFAVPEGGAGALSAALVRVLEARGGTVQLGQRVASITVEGGRVRAVHTASSDSFEPRLGVLADTSAPALYLDLLEPEHVPGFVRRRMRRFPQGWGTFKVDWALDGPVPWSVEEARRSAVVHLGDDLEDLVRFTREVRGGALPGRPYLVIGQQSLVDPSRAPDGGHTLWAYSRVPAAAPGGWDAQRERFADRVEERIEEQAPGFRARVLARRVDAPPDLEAANPNLIGGDLGGGSNAWHRQLIFRPVFPYFRYRTPVKGLYLCSSYAHPGAGVHGMCGYNAARLAARDAGA